MKISRSVLSALVAVGAVSAFALSTTSAYANDTRTEGSRSDKMRSDSKGMPHDARGTGDSRSMDHSRGTADSRTTDTDTRSAADKVSDQALETKVKTALIGDSRVKARKIEVEVRNGVVNLSGTVASQTEAESAIATARRVSGVSVVNSRLAVGATQ